jgi:RecA-family ATPase
MSTTDPVDPAKAIAAKLQGAARPNGRRQPPPAPLRIVDPCSFTGQPIPERRWVVPYWVPIGVATGLYGPGGYGKTLLAQQLMTAAALGKPWLGQPVSQVRSVGIFCEDDEDELRRRQSAINHQLYNCDLGDLGNIRWVPRLGEDNILMTFARDGRGALTPLFEQVREAALDFDARLVVIDTVADTFGGNQNDAGQVRQYVQFGLARLARAIGGAVLACAHPSRSGINSGTGESGSVQWDAAFRSRLYLSAPKKDGDDEPADPDARVLTRVKANYAARDEALELRWRDGVLSAEMETGDGDDRPDAEAVFMVLLDKMIAEGQSLSHNSRAGNYAPKLFLSRPERQGYRLPDFTRAMQALLSMGEIQIEEYGRPSHRGQRIIRGVPVPF